MNTLNLHKILSFKIIVLFILSIFLSNTLLAQTLPSRTVVIDPGHGGKDPGANIGKVKEKDIVLKIALLLGGYIEEHLQNIKVIYTRSTDEFIELHERSAIANRNNADLFISIHIDAISSSSIQGTSTYVMGLHKADENLEVAKRENAVILKEDNYKKNYQGFDPNSPESEIIFSLYQNAYLNQSIRFADMVQKQFKNRAMRHDRGVRQAGLVVLWNCSMPSVLIETGFITHSAERNFLTSNYGQSIIASAIFRAVREYFGDQYRRDSPPSSGTTQKTGTTQASTPQHNKPVSSTHTQNKQDNSKIIFKVQIASSPRKIDTKAENFKGLQSIEREFLDGSYKYYAASTNSYDEVLMLQTEIRKKYPDAFVVAIKNNQRISMDQAIAEGKN